MICQGRSDRRRARCHTTGTGGSSDPAPIPRPGTCLLPGNYRKNILSLHQIRVIAKQHHNVSYGKNLHVAVVIVVVVVVVVSVVVHGCERNGGYVVLIDPWRT